MSGPSGLTAAGRNECAGGAMIASPLSLWGQSATGATPPTAATQPSRGRASTSEAGEQSPPGVARHNPQRLRFAFLRLQHQPALSTA